MMKKDCLYALYQGKEYEVEHDLTDKKVYLYSTDPEDQLLGFHEIRHGLFEKVVLPTEIQSAYDITTYAEYGGHKFQAKKLGSTKVLLTYSGMQSRIPKELGFAFVEPYVFEKEVNEEEVTRIWQEKQPLWGYSLPSEE